MMNEICALECLELILTTEGNYLLAESLAKSLLESKLVACVTLHKVESLYWWKNQIQNSNEVQLMIKTNKRNLDDLNKKILELHSYQVPEFIHLQSDSSIPYLNWLNSELPPRY